MKSISIPLLKKIGREAIKLTDTLSHNKRKENYIDGIVLGYLQAKVGSMAYQYNFKIKGRTKRIDFRRGGTNPAFIELVVVKHGAEQYASQNRSELYKLTRMPITMARFCGILILDPREKESIPKEKLRKTYVIKNAGRGRFYRRSVKIIYVHREKDKSYNFLWKPKKRY